MGHGCSSRCAACPKDISSSSGAAAPGSTTFHGDTHAFGNTEEKCIREVLGLAARDGRAAWDPTTGTGAVKATPGLSAVARRRLKGAGGSPPRGAQQGKGSLLDPVKLLRRLFELDPVEPERRS